MIWHRKLRPAYATTLAIFALALLATFALVLAHYAALDLRREREAMLETYVQQAAESARAWTIVHGVDAVQADGTVVPIVELLPAGASGEVRLCRTTTGDGSQIIECRVTVVYGPRTVHRTLRWPCVPPATRHPATGPATP